MTVTHVLGVRFPYGDSVIYLVANGCRSLDLTPEFYRIVEVLLQTGAVLGTDGCFASQGLALANP